MFGGAADQLLEGGGGGLQGLVLGVGLDRRERFVFGEKGGGGWVLLLLFLEEGLEFGVGEGGGWAGGVVLSLH